MEIIANSWEFILNLVRDGKNVSHFMLPIYLGCLALERIIYYFTDDHYNGKDAFTSLTASAFNNLFAVFVGGIVQYTIYMWLYNNFRVWDMPYTWWGWVLVFLAHDFFYYTDHRISHRMGFFWALHSVHHSSKEFNFSTANRGGFLDGILGTMTMYLMAVMGIDMLQFAMILTVTNLFGIFNHTRLVRNMGFLEYILATPSNHAVHHAKNTKYLDKNYGQVLIIWDIMFNSFKREDHEEPVYGLTKDIDTHNPIYVELAGWKWLYDQMKTAPRWSDKLRYLIMPPGWSHTGNHETTESLTLNHANHAVQEV
jgi:sterol desaturase/sphingolipid hydroxylase (fatty acid hydroxylase superfamily)